MYPAVILSQGYSNKIAFIFGSKILEELMKNSKRKFVLLCLVVRQRKAISLCTQCKLCCYRSHMDGGSYVGMIVFKDRRKLLTEYQHQDSMGDSKDCVIFQFRVPLELPLGRGEVACFINPFSPSPACISKYSAGCINYYPGLHSTLNKGQMEKFEAELRYYVTRKIGFEAVMRIRCTKGKLFMT